MIDSGLHPVAKEWLKTSENECQGKSHFRGVGLSKKDIIATIEERAAKHNLSTIYMATDGWIRGAEGLALVKEVRGGSPNPKPKHHHVLNNLMSVDYRDFFLIRVLRTLTGLLCRLFCYCGGGVFMSSDCGAFWAFQTFPMERTMILISPWAIIMWYVSDS